MTKTLTTPGFWDLHLHGVAGVDFMHADEDAMAFACERLGAHGAAAFAPTLLTSEPRLLLEACARLGAFLERAARPGFLPKSSARPLSLHLEGPFLSPGMAGAHPKKHLHQPPEVVDRLVSAARGHVAIVTLAPELPGAFALIRRLVRRGIRVQLGHSMASDAIALKAAAAGASGLTHLFNAMPIHHRRPGLLAPLTQRLITAEVITDGVHVAPDFITWIHQAAPRHIYAVSDGCSAVGARPRQPLTLGSLVLRREGLRAVVAKTGTLAGGATYLSQHPQLIGKHMGNQDFLELYYRLQRQFFPQAARSVRMVNHFDARTLRFLGCEC